jgi:hypothetical protein
VPLPDALSNIPTLAALESVVGEDEMLIPSIVSSNKRCSVTPFKLMSSIDHVGHFVELNIKLNDVVARKHQIMRDFNLLQMTIDYPNFAALFAISDHDVIRGSPNNALRSKVRNVCDNFLNGVTNELKEFNDITTSIIEDTTLDGAPTVIPHEATPEAIPIEHVLPDIGVTINVVNQSIVVSESIDKKIRVSECSTTLVLGGVQIPIIGLLSDIPQLDILGIDLKPAPSSILDVHVPYVHLFRDANSSAKQIPSIEDVALVRATHVLFEDGQYFPFFVAGSKLIDFKSIVRQHSVALNIAAALETVIEKELFEEFCFPSQMSHVEQMWKFKNKVCKDYSISTYLMVMVHDYPDEVEISQLFFDLCPFNLGERRLLRKSKKHKIGSVLMEIKMDRHKEKKIVSHSSESLEGSVGNGDKLPTIPMLRTKLMEGRIDSKELERLRLHTISDQRRQFKLDRPNNLSSEDDVLEKCMLDAIVCAYDNWSGREYIPSNHIYSLNAIVPGGLSGDKKLQKNFLDLVAALQSKDIGVCPMDHSKLIGSPLLVEGKLRSKLGMSAITVLQAFNQQKFPGLCISLTQQDNKGRGTYSLSINPGGRNVVRKELMTVMAYSLNDALVAMAVNLPQVACC